MKKPIGADTNDNGNSTKDCGYASVFLDDEMVPKVKTIRENPPKIGPIRGQCFCSNVTVTRRRSRIGLAPISWTHGLRNSPARELVFVLHRAAIA